MTVRTVITTALIKQILLHRRQAASIYEVTRDRSVMVVENRCHRRTLRDRSLITLKDGNLASTTDLQRLFPLLLINHLLPSGIVAAAARVLTITGTLMFNVAFETDSVFVFDFHESELFMATVKELTTHTRKEVVSRRTRRYIH
jgi:hypothetical protein